MKNNCDNNYILFNKGLGETNKMEYINWISDESAAGIGLTNNLYSKNNYPINDSEVTSQSRVTHPAWAFRELDSKDLPNNFKYLHLNPQENVCYPFENNLYTPGFLALM